MADGGAPTARITEDRLTGGDQLEYLSTLELVRLTAEQDAAVPLAIARACDQIAAAVDAITARMRDGGRLIYLGAGTAGRVGTLDASECPPTFGTPPGQVTALIAGGPTALTGAVEGAEDSPDLAVADLEQIRLTDADAVVGLSASGSTPYTVSGVRHARRRGALTVAVVCNTGSTLARAADLAIEVVVGPELIAGSTRLKAGTAQKLVCNTLSTLTMVRLGRTYGNLMVHVTATNRKLLARAHRLVRLITGRDDDTVAAALDRARGSVPVAVIMLNHGVDEFTARRRLTAAGGSLRAALAESAPASAR